MYQGVCCREELEVCTDSAEYQGGGPVGQYSCGVPGLLGFEYCSVGVFCGTVIIVVGTAFLLTATMLLKV